MIKSLLLVLVTFQQQADTTLTAQDAVAIALEKNFDLRVQRNVREIATNDNSLGNAGFLPTVEATGNYGAAVQNTEQEFISGDQQAVQGARRNELNAGVNAAWTLFDGLRMFASKERLSLQENASDLQLKGMIQNTTADVLKAFYSAALEQERQQLLESTLGLSEERVRISKDKYEVGKASKLEYLQAQVDLNSDKSALVRQRETATTRKLELYLLMGTEEKELRRLQYSYDLETAISLEQAEANALSSNPDLRALETQREVAMVTVTERERELLPSLDFNLGYAYSNLTAEAGFLRSNRTNGINYGLSARWMLFDGLNQSRTIQNAKLQAESSMIQYDAAKLRLLNSVRTAFIAYQNALTLIQVEEENLEVARENEEISLERYRIGKSNSLEIREAQINALNAQTRYAEARYAAKIAEIELMRLSGMLVQ